MSFALSGRRLQDSVGKLAKPRRMAEAEAIGLKEQSPLGWFLARRALPFEREAEAITLLRLKN